MATVGTGRVVSALRTALSLRGILPTMLAVWLAAGCIPTPTASPATPSPGGTTPALPTIPPTETPVVAAATPTPLPPRTPTVPTSAEEVVLEVWECLSPEPARVLRQDAAEFREQHPGITLTLRHCEDALAWPELLTTGVAQGWHVLLGNAALLAALQQKGFLQPIEDLLPPRVLTALATPAQVAATRDNHLWGLADTLGFHLLLYYRRELVATPPMDTDALTTLARSLTDAAGHWGLALNSYDPLWVIPWLGACGEWLTDARGQFTLDTPAMVRALGMYRDWHRRRGGIAPLTTHDLARQMFVEGQAAMLLDGDWALGELEQIATLDWAVAALPTMGTAECAATPLVLGRFWMVRRDLPLAVQRAAADWLRYVFAPQRQVRWALRFDALPTHREALQDVRILGDARLRVSAQQMQLGRALPLGVDANHVLAAMRAPLRAVLDGSMTPEEAARAMQRNALHPGDAADAAQP